MPRPLVNKDGFRYEIRAVELDNSNDPNYFIHRINSNGDCTDDGCTYNWRSKTWDREFATENATNSPREAIGIFKRDFRGFVFTKHGW